MANDLNQCNFIGRLGADPESRYMPNGDRVVSFSVAVGERWKDATSGEQKENTEWVRCVAWKKLAEICAEYLKKGSQVFVSGRMKTRRWTDRDGHERYSTEVVIDRMQMLGGRSDSAGGAARASSSKPAAGPAADAADSDKAYRDAKDGKAAPAAAKKPAGKFDDMEDDIPF